MKSVLLLCFLVTVAVARQSRIHNGQVITQDEVDNKFQFVVAIAATKVTARGWYLIEDCTGSVIAKNKVLTAAHCFCGDYDYIDVSSSNRSFLQIT